MRSSARLKEFCSGGGDKKVTRYPNLRQLYSAASAHRRRNLLNNESSACFCRPAAPAFYVIVN
jgi:hypothetical protein